ncbi:MAG: hemerythrin domain-containing protein [Burkholderiaceae bacterium]
MVTKKSVKSSTQKTATRSSRKTASKKAAPSKTQKSEAIAQLTADHARVKKMFKQYDRLAKADAGSSERQQLAKTICAELVAHATAEEELFYPAARKALAEPDLIDEADVEHASAKDLIAQIESSSPSDDHYDAKVKVLGEYINHHVQEEEGEMFPKVRRAKVDTVTLGQQIEARKAELMQAKAKA